MPQPDQPDQDPQRRDFLRKGLKSAALLPYIAPAIETFHLSEAWGDGDDDDDNDNANQNQNGPVSVIGNHPPPPPPAPRISGCSPREGYQGDELSVRITGEYFQRHARVRFSGTGITVNTVHFTSSRLLIVAITISSSAREGERDVTVTNPDGQSNTKRRCFKVKKRKAPEIRSVDPNQGRVGTYVNVRITGKYFWGHVTVSFGSDIVVSNVVCVSSGLITARLYIRATAHIGYRDVTVRNPDHQEVTKRNAFRVTRSGDGDDDDDDDRG